jgi:hypothetical protein
MKNAIAGPPPMISSRALGKHAVEDFAALGLFVEDLISRIEFPRFNLAATEGILVVDGSLWVGWKQGRRQLGRRPISEVGCESQDWVVAPADPVQPTPGIGRRWNSAGTRPVWRYSS